jgi:hypothetical protein
MGLQVKARLAAARHSNCADRWDSQPIVGTIRRRAVPFRNVAGISKRLKFLDIDLVGVHDGKASTVTVGLRGLVGQLFREDNAHKVRRGLAGRVAQGLSGGGQAYGYRPDPLNKGQMLIVDDEAESSVVSFANTLMAYRPVKSLTA